MMTCGKSKLTVDFMLIRRFHHMNTHHITRGGNWTLQTCERMILQIKYFSLIDPSQISH